MRKVPYAGFGAGVLAANSVPHLHAWATGATHLTPLGGRRSSPRLNALWGALNLLAATVIVARTAREDRPAQRRAFKAGLVTFSAWSLAAEWVTDLHD